MSENELEPRPDETGPDITDEEFRLWLDSLSPEEADAYAKELLAKLDNGQIKRREITLLAEAAPPDMIRRALIEVLSQPRKLDDFARGVLRNCKGEDLSVATEILAKLLDYFGQRGIGPGAKRPS